MKTKFLHAWTLPELLVVMILYGIIFIALLDAADLIGYFSARVTHKWEATSKLLNAYQQMDLLMEQADSVSCSMEGLRLYRNEVEWAWIRQAEDVLLCDYRGRKDTLWQGFGELDLCMDSLRVFWDDNRGEIKCYWKIRKIVWP